LPDWEGAHPEFGSNPSSSGASHPESPPEESSPADGCRVFCVPPEFEAVVGGGDVCAPGFATATPAVRATNAPTEVPAAMARLRFIRLPRGAVMTA